MPVKKITIDGVDDRQKRIASRILEAEVQEAVNNGERNMLIKAQGQHGIGGRLMLDGTKCRITVEGTSGQRLGSMGTEGTELLVKGSASDDIGWINCGANITVLGDVTNGAHNAAAKGKLYVQGGGGARCDTMTKHNPRFEPPESWYFRDVGDSFAEFKAGGIAVVCGVNPRNEDNILGYRPCVGMVGGAVYFRGKIQGFSEHDVQLVELTAQDWQWLTKNMKPYLKAIKREDYLKELTQDIKEWHKFIAYTPAEKSARKGKRRNMTDFRLNAWDKEVGKGGIFGSYITHERTNLPYVTTGTERRQKPVWANEKYLPPCAYSCPSRIPSHKRATLLRQGKTQEALELVLRYSPLPATVCGEVCPNLCMQSCSRGLLDRPLNIKEYGRIALDQPAPKPAKSTGYKIGIIGAGPAGLSAAWQLALKGHSVDLYEAEGTLGGKIDLAIPHKRLPRKILQKELSRFREVGVKLHLGKKVTRKLYDKIYKQNEMVIISCGAHEPRIIKFKGFGDLVPGIEFLKNINYGKGMNLKGKRVVVIGAGNVGMDVCLQAYGQGAKNVTAIDVQEPAAFGVEVTMATELGTKILWPKFTQRYSKRDKKLYFNDGTSIDADLVIMSIGEVPALDFLPRAIHTERGHIAVNHMQQTSDLKVYAIGDATRPGLITNAIGQGRIAADVIHSELLHFDYRPEIDKLLPKGRVKGEYYDICQDTIFTPQKEAFVCMSCGSCRDCHMCEATCAHGAISRTGDGDSSFEYVVDADKCIGCGFCAGVCPCGVWEMAENL